MGIKAKSHLIPLSICIATLMMMMMMEDNYAQHGFAAPADDDIEIEQGNYIYMHNLLTL